jgi:hypothetical protein
MLVSVVYFDQVIGVIRKLGTGDHVQRYLLPKRAEVADGKGNQHIGVPSFEMRFVPRFILG